jgi:hypothetical protein
MSNPCIICGRPALPGIPFCPACSTLDQVGALNYSKPNQEDRDPLRHSPVAEKIKSGRSSEITEKDEKTHWTLMRLNFLFDSSIPWEIRSIAYTIPDEDFWAWHKWYFFGDGSLFGEGYLKKIPFPLEEMHYLRSVMATPTSFTIKTKFLEQHQKESEAWNRARNWISKNTNIDIEVSNDNVIRTRFPDNNSEDYSYYVSKKSSFKQIDILVRCFGNGGKLNAEISDINEHILAYHIRQESNEFEEKIDNSKFINLPIEEAIILIQSAFPWRSPKWHQEAVMGQIEEQKTVIEEILNKERVDTEREDKYKTKVDKDQKAKKVPKLVKYSLWAILIIILWSLYKYC